MLTVGSRTTRGAGNRSSLIAIAVLGAVLAMLPALSGCSRNAGLSNMWRDATYQQTVKKVLVVAMKDDPSLRRLWEDQLAGGLAEHGVTSTPSYRLFPDAVPDTQLVSEVVQRDTYDGVLVVFSLPPETSERFVPGYVTTEPVTRIDPWTRRWVTQYLPVRHPGYTETNQVIRQQVDLWSTENSGRLVWSGTGEVMNPTEPGQVRTEVTGLILPELEEQGIIPPKVKS